MTRLLSEASVNSICGLGECLDFDDDVLPALTSVQLPATQAELVTVSTDTSFGYHIPSTRDHIKKSLSDLDFTDPDVVGRVLRFTGRISEVYNANPKANKAKLIRLRNDLADDGCSIQPAGDPIAAILGLSVTAGTALTDAAAVRIELDRLERALPTDACQAIGRAKNLVEATAKAVLSLLGEPVNDKDDMPALVQKASIAAGVHPKHEPAHREQIIKILGQTSGITQSLAELRNAVGDGHGAASIPNDITLAYGRLAARAAITWSAFLLDTVTAP